MGRPKCAHLFGTTAALPSLLQFMVPVSAHSFFLLPIRAKELSQHLSEVSVGLALLSVEDRERVADSRRVLADEVVEELAIPIH